MMKVKFSFFLLSLLLFALVPVIMADTNAQENNVVIRNVPKIAFVSKRDSNFEVYTINEDGTDLKRLTNSKDDDLKPQWSPDGTKILYLSKNGGKYALRVMNSDGSGQAKLANDCVIDYPPSWSPDGAKILFVAKAKSKNAIFTIDADGGNLIRLTEIDTDGAYPLWSPDGSKVLFRQRYRSDTYIYTINPDGTGRLKLTREKGDYLTFTWSPDGRKIAYISFNSKLWGNYNKIYTIDADGGNNLEIINCSKKSEDINYYDELNWSPDGTTLAFNKVAEAEVHMSENGSMSFTYIYGTYIVGSNGDSREQLLGKTGAERVLPGWAPDSSKLAFLYNSKLTFLNMKNKVEDAIKVDVAIPLSHVRWSPGGTKLIFAGKSSSFQKSALYLVTLDGKVTVLSEANDYDPVWSPVGK